LKNGDYWQRTRGLPCLVSKLIFNGKKSIYSSEKKGIIPKNPSEAG
jgi:hypothetical protein